METLRSHPIVSGWNICKVMLVALCFITLAGPVLAHISSPGCTGSGLGITLFTNLPEVNIGDTIFYSVVVFNGSGSGPVVCDATSIQASLITPDGVTHPILLSRTALSNGESDFYPNVVSYVAQLADMAPNGTLPATASDTGIIHQNVVDSQGGANQGLNVYVLNTLHIIKQVVNSNGGVAIASDFNLHVKSAGVDVAGSPAAGVAVPGTLYSLIADTYTVSEDAFTGYVATFSGDCDASGNVILLGGEDKTCTVTNTDTAPTLQVIKQVVNASGGTQVASDFNLHVKNAGVDVLGSPAVGMVTPGTSYSLSVGTYVVSEDVNALYTQSFSGDCDSAGSVTLVLGDNKTCTIINTDIAPKLHIIKNVVNNNGGLATAADFNLHVTTGGVDVLGSPATGVGTPGTLYTLSAASYTVSEDSVAGYAGTFSGDCDSAGNITLALADDKTCTITNDDIAPLDASITVVKMVVNNQGGTSIIAHFPLFVGTIPVISGATNIFLPGLYVVTEINTLQYTQAFSGDCDSSGNISIVAGDNKICIITNDDIAPPLPPPPPPPPVVTPPPTSGGFGGRSIPSPLFIVPIFPNTGSIEPQIHITKIPSPVTFLAGGGAVTYTQIVTNPGTIALEEVLVVDDKCAPVTYVSGDINQDNKLDTNEYWTYTCRSYLSTTTTNTATATGQANGFTVQDTAQATVTVSVPKLPNTGFGLNVCQKK